MSEQMALAGFESPEQDEHDFLRSILPALMDAVETSGGPSDLIAYKSTKANKKSGSGYTSVYYGNFMVFRLRMRRGQQYISVPVLFKDLIPADYPTKQIKSELKYCRLLIDGQHPVESYTSFLSQIAGETVNRYPEEWDCCSRYAECSDAKSCIHPDRTFALGCGYRKNLSSGHIFYGKNRNID